MEDGLRSNNNVQKTCFIICPIGSSKTAIRARSDKILRFVIEPVCKRYNLKVERADEIDEPGLISRNVIIRLFNSDLVIADLTGHNPNVFYELAIRHASNKPVIQLIESGEKIPFDISDVSTIYIDHTDLESVDACKSKLDGFIISCLNGKYGSNPIIDAIKTDNIDVPFIRHEHVDLASQFQRLSEKILNEIKTLRSERNMLIDKVVDETVSHITVKGKSKYGQRFDASGLWNSSFGTVKLTQSGNDVIGGYHYMNVWGEIRGKVVDNRILFQWTWEEFEGVGYWKISDDQLQGRWFYLAQSCSYEELLENPERLDQLTTTNRDQWLLWRQPNR